jgi:hypothetical protein
MNVCLPPAGLRIKLLFLLWQSGGAMNLIQMGLGGGGSDVIALPRPETAPVTMTIFIF